AAGGRTESVDGLGGIRDEPMANKMEHDTGNRRLDFGFGAEGDHDAGTAPLSAARAAAIRKSVAVVIFMLRALPGTMRTGYPSRSQSAASSVAGCAPA